MRLLVKACCPTNGKSRKFGSYRRMCKKVVFGFSLFCRSPNQWKNPFPTNCLGPIFYIDGKKKVFLHFQDGGESAE
jgi:hypothetical protein